MKFAAINAHRCLTWILTLLVLGVPGAAGAERDGSPAGPTAAPAAPEAVRDAFVTLHAWSFSGFDFNGAMSVSGVGYRYCEGLSGCTFRTGAPLPHRATLVGLEIEGCNEEPENGVGIVVAILRTPGESQADALAIAGIASGCGFHFAPLDTPHVVDQYLGSYFAQVTIWAQGSEAPSYSERFAAVRLYYRPGDGALVPTGTEASLFP